MLSCTNQKSTDYSKINDLEDLNEEVIKDFYYNVLDTLVGDCYFQSKPIQKTELMGDRYNFSEASIVDKDFFKLQIDKFKSLRWENLIKREKLLFDREIDTIFSQGARKGWEVFKEKYGEGCICFISIPLFTKDFKKVYIDYGRQCEALWGHGEIIVFELINEKWILKERHKTWIS